MDHILCIDQGTTSTKAFLLTEEGVLTKGFHKEFEQHYPQPGWVSHDAEEIYSSVLAAIAGVLRENPGAIGHIKAMGLTNQRETTLAFDTKGKPVTEAIVWQCRRTSDICRRPEIRGEDRYISEVTGLKVDPYFSATKMLWLFENNEGLKERCEAGEVYLSTIDGFLVCRLTAGASFASDYSNCSRTMLFDIAKKDYDEHLLTLFGVPRQALAKPQESCSDYGAIAISEEDIRAAGLDGEGGGDSSQDGDDELNDFRPSFFFHCRKVLKLLIF